MFPLRALPAGGPSPWISRLLVVACIAVFAWQYGQNGTSLGIGEWGARPACLLAPSGCGFDAMRAPRAWLLPWVTSLFLHASVLHLAFNVWFLWVFGPSVEEKLGHIRFFVFYFACGIAANAAYVASQPFSKLPIVGASGAIAGVLGAFLVLRPRGWVLSYVPPFWFFPIPAPLFLVLWFGAQIGGALKLGPQTGASNVAWLAHIGGFAFGALWAWRKVRRRARKKPAPKRESARAV